MSAEGEGDTPYRASAFRLGVVAATLGILLHVPMFLATAEHGYRMAGMMSATDPVMVAGMTLILGGVGLCAYSVAWRAGGTRVAEGERWRVDVVEGKRLSGRDVLLLGGMTVALVVDGMKPATLGFVMPGMREEYGLTALEIGLLPSTGVAGTVLGSVLWGIGADRFGRRNALLLAVVMFISTAVCGVMPTYGWNLVMCFLMGVSAGGMLPVVFSMLAETIPASRYGRLAMLVSGIGAAGGYLAASGASVLLEPVYGWRMLWLIGLPTGLMLLPLISIVPESPRYLMLRGQRTEALEAVRRLGGRLVPVVAEPVNWRPARITSYAACLFGFACGLVQLGLLTWLPTMLRNASAEGISGDVLLGRAALVALPITLLMAWVYQRTRSWLLLGAVGAATTVASFGIALWNAFGLGETALLVTVILLLVTLNSSLATLNVYSAQLFPTKLRAGFTGVVAAATKLGGLVGPQLLALLIAAGVSITLPITFFGILLLVAAGLVARYGGRRVELPYAPEPTGS